MVNWGKLIFGGVDSSDYGIYITGESVYNAPEREVEFIDIPGRNGSLAMDKGRYNNITVTYPAGTFGKNQEDFREALSAFRNAILSQKGYQRLEDTYHPEEYRMGVYAAGLEVSPASRGKAGQFDLTFECKPQRFLTIGDYPIPVDSGDVLQNPTLFDSHPLVMVEGYGTVAFNGYSFTLTDEEVGYIILSDLLESFTPNTQNVNKLENILKFNIPFFTLASGDVFTTHGERWIGHIGVSGISSNASYVVQSNTFPTAPTVSIDTYSTFIAVYIRTVITSLVYGTSKNSVAVIRVTIPTSSGNKVYDMTVSEKYDASSGEFISSLLIEGINGAIFNSSHTTIDIDMIDSTSTFTVLGHPTYIDCDIGEVYKIEDGNIVLLNSYISMGSDLPTLSPASNRITFDNTIEEVKISPRWWKI